MTPPVRYNVAQTAKLIGKSPSWLYQKGAAGLIPRSKLGHHVWWTEEQIAEILKSAEQPAKQAKQREQRPPEQKRKPQARERQAQPKRQSAPANRNPKIPQADHTVSRLYRTEASA